MSGPKSWTLRWALAVFAALALTAALAVAAAPAVASEPDESSDKAAWLGIYMQAITPEISEAFNLKGHEGVLVNEVIAGSPADKSGLKEGDVITAIDGDQVDSPEALSEQVKRRSPGEVIKIAVLRDGKAKSYEVALGEYKAAAEDYAKLGDEYAKKYSKMIFHSATSGYMGVMLSSLSEQLAEYFGVENGALVTEVEEDSPAAKAGLKAGDVIVSLDDKSVEDPSDATEIIRDHKKGDKVAAEVMRRGSRQEFTLEVDERDWGGTAYGFSTPDMNLAPFMQGYQFNLTPDELKIDRDQLKQQMDQLRDELQKMREELNQLKRKSQ